MASLLVLRTIAEKRNELANETDLSIIAITWGFTLGFGTLTTWTAIKQTRHMWKRRNGNLDHPYVFLIWGELLSCLVLSVVCWLVLQGPLSINVWTLIIILSLWVIQVHFLFQIIINRVSILMVNRKRALQLKIGTAVLITLVNISVFCIWIPARLQVNDTYERLNVIWDRIEKVIILLVDAGLNYYFVRIVQKQLVKPGLTKYRPLVRFNLYMILISLAMDCLIIGMLSLQNNLVYLMFHPLAYCVKLKIEMSMAELIAHVSRKPGTGAAQFKNPGSSGFHSENGTVSGKGFTFTTTQTTQGKRDSIITQKPRAQSVLHDVELGDIRSPSPEPVHNHFGIIEEEESIHHNEEMVNGFIVHRHDEVTMEVESAPSERSAKTDGQCENLDLRRHTPDSDEAPLRKQSTNMGLNTKVWGHY